jgi:eukaryotic-like serine/threonine-protein kinase
VRRAARQFGSVRSRRWLLEGLLAWAEGDHSAARERWRRAEAIALRKGTRFELARARYEIARHSDAVERGAYLTDAATTFERLGALQMLRRVREAQANDEAKGAGR